jgi:hypothetical protein
MAKSLIECPVLLQQVENVSIFQLQSSAEKLPELGMEMLSLLSTLLKLSDKSRPPNYKFLLDKATGRTENNA